jgi:hypothetical protein
MPEGAGPGRTCHFIAKQPYVQRHRLEIPQVLASTSRHNCQHIAAIPDVVSVLLHDAGHMLLAISPCSCTSYAELGPATGSLLLERTLHAV